jgi:hypothetical protein
LDRHLGLLIGLLSLAGCGGSTSSPPPSPPVSAAQAFETAVEATSARINVSVSDAASALTDYQAGQLTSALFTQRIQADYGQVALSDQAFIAQLGTIPFPNAMHGDVAALVAAVARHRDASRAVTTAALPDLGTAIQATADTNSAESSAVDLVRSDLGPRPSPS